MFVNSKNSNMKPLITIGIPVFNGEKFLNVVIDSLLEQTYSNFELIISDNCSEDSTEFICRKYQILDSRIKYFRQKENIGMFPNFNFLLNKASGDYFMWAAADDKWEKIFLEQAEEILENNPDCVSVFSHFEIFDINNGKIIEKITPSSIASNLPYLRIKRTLNELHPNLIYGLHRKSFIIDNAFESFDMSDLLFISRLVTKGKYFIIPKVLYWVGINGSKRKPYSISGDYVDLNMFRKKAIMLLLKHSSIMNVSCIIELIKISIKIFFIQIKINKAIKNWSFDKNELKT